MKIFKFLVLSLIVSCSGNKVRTDGSGQKVYDSVEQICENPEDNDIGIDYEMQTVKTRYEVPEGFHRIEGERGSFAEFLQNLPLKPKDSPTHIYDGSEKQKKVATSVIDFDVDSLGLEQSIDAVVRLWSEYLYRSKQYEKIGFYFSNGFRCDYSKWAQGYRVRQNGSKMEWYQENKVCDYSYPAFRDYLQTVYRNIDVESLCRDMEDADGEDFGVGTVIISNTTPPHLGIVVDMIRKNSDSNTYSHKNDIGVLVAQGGNPSQEIEILKGNGDELAIFPKRDKYGSGYGQIWISSNKGEMPIYMQGGRILTYEDDICNKILKKYKNYD